MINVKQGLIREVVQLVVIHVQLVLIQLKQVHHVQLVPLDSIH